jgi:hypothetical protein
MVLIKQKLGVQVATEIANNAASKEMFVEFMQCLGRKFTWLKSKSKWDGFISYLVLGIDLY